MDEATLPTDLDSVIYEGSWPYSPDKGSRHPVTPLLRLDTSFAVVDETSAVLSALAGL